MRVMTWRALSISPYTLESTALRVLILDGGGNFIGGTEPSGRIVYVTCATATLEKYPQAVGVGGSFYAVTCLQGRAVQVETSCTLC
jgi:hypothetical protein